jgi:drug/metabolite transporter (DMT)-like permease
MDMPDLYWTFTSVTALVFSVLGFGVLVFHAKKEFKDRMYKPLFLACLGALVGACLAVLLVPYSSVDKPIFSNIIAVMTGIITFYGVVKSQKLLDALLYADVEQKQPSSTVLWYLCFLVGGLLLAMMPIVICRTEWLTEAAICWPDFYGPVGADGNRSATAPDIKCHLHKKSDKEPAALTQ